MKSRGRGVLVTPHARGMTTGCGAQTVTPSLRAERSNPGPRKDCPRGPGLLRRFAPRNDGLEVSRVACLRTSLVRNVTRSVTAGRAYHAASAKICPAITAKINRLALNSQIKFNYRRPGST